MKVYELMHLPGLIMFYGLQEEEKEMIVTILGNIEVKHTELLPRCRNKSIYDTCNEHLGRNEAQYTYYNIARMVENFKKEKQTIKTKSGRKGTTN